MNTIQRATTDIVSSQLKNEKKDFSLKQGQVIVGRIKQANADGTTTISVGDKEISAKIQGGNLRENGVYAFKVVDTKDGTAELKPYLPTQLSSKQFDGVVQELLSQFRLKGNDQAKGLIEGLLQKGSPIERRAIVQMLNLIGNQKLTSEALHTLDFMNKNGIPFERNVFQFIMAANTKDTLSKGILQLIQNLQDVKAPTVDALKQWFTQFDKSQQTLQTLAQAQISTLKEPTAPTFHKNDFAFQNLSTSRLPKLTAEAIMSQIKNQFPTLTSNDIHVLVRGMNQAVTQVLPKVLNQLDFEQSKQLLQTLVNAGRITIPNQMSELAAQSLDKIFSLQLSKGNQAQASQAQTGQLQGNQAQASQTQTVQLQGNQAQAGQSQPTTEEAKVAAQTTRATGVDSSQSTNQGQQLGQTDRAASNQSRELFENSAAQFMKNMVGKLGLNYESMMRNNSQALSVEEQLKPLLLQILADGQLPPAVHRDAEHLLARLTGLQVLSQTADVSLQSYHMSIPLFGLGLNSDLEICWQGKRKENGDLDPDFCRIIFDVELGEIGRTVMDMQIVDRIIRLGIYTEENIEEIANQFLEGLEVGLEEHGYTLGKIQFNMVDLAPEEQEGGFHASMMNWLEQSDCKGFDIRI